MAQKEEYADKYWSAYATTYDSQVGRMTRKAAERLVVLSNELKPYSAPNTYALDSGAGTGVTTTSLSGSFPSIPILATDVSPEMLAVIDSAKLPNVTTKVVDASKPGALGAGIFSHALSTFMIQFLSNPQEVVEEMHRTLQPGGVIGLGIWDQHNDPINAWGKACRAVDPSYVVPKAHDPSAWYSTEELETALKEAGFVDIRTDIVRVDFNQPDAESLVRFWFEAKNPSMESLINAWKGSKEEVKREMARIVREEHEDGGNLIIDFALAVGKKVV